VPVVASHHGGESSNMFQSANENVMSVSVVTPCP